MKKNMSTTDRAIRLLIAVVAIIMIATGKVTGTTAIIAGVVAGIFALTGFVRICPLYIPFGINTNKKQQ